METFKNEAINLETLPRFEEVQFNSISGKYLVKSILQTSIVLIFLLVGWGVLYYFEIGSPFLMFGLAAILVIFVFKLWNSFMMQKRYGFALREKDILYRRGFFISSITILPFNRVQHVAVSRDALDKLLNLSSLQVFTAGGSGSDISIPGLVPELAARLKEALASRLTPNDD